MPCNGPAGSNLVALKTRRQPGSPARRGPLAPRGNLATTAVQRGRRGLRHRRVTGAWPHRGGRDRGTGHWPRGTEVSNAVYALGKAWPWSVTSGRFAENLSASAITVKEV